MASTRIIKEVNYVDFKELINGYKDKIKVSPHAYFRLSEMQRKVYKDEALISLLSEERPAFVGLQQNQNYAAFFRRKEGFMKLIFEVTKEKIEIITFYFTDHIPKI